MPIGFQNITHIHRANSVVFYYKIASLQEHNSYEWNKRPVEHERARRENIMFEIRNSKIEHNNIIYMRKCGEFSIRQRRVCALLYTNCQDGNLVICFFSDFRTHKMI